MPHIPEAGQRGSYPKFLLVILARPGVPVDPCTVFRREYVFLSHLITKLKPRGNRVSSIGPSVQIPMEGGENLSRMNYQCVSRSYPSVSECPLPCLWRSVSATGSAQSEGQGRRKARTIGILLGVSGHLCTPRGQCGRRPLPPPWSLHMCGISPRSS